MAQDAAAVLRELGVASAHVADARHRAA